MAWEKYQIDRIEIEDAIIQRFFPTFTLYSKGDCKYWEGSMITNNKKKYRIRIELPNDYPDAVPMAFIISPCPLYDYTKNLMTSYGTSHSMHVFASENEYVEMCIFRSESWSADYTVYKCLKKVRVWLEAFEIHLRTGELMSDILGTQE